MTKIPELYASMCFNDKVMAERLPEDVYKSLKDNVSLNLILSEKVEIIKKIGENLNE